MPNTSGSARPRMTPAEYAAALRELYLRLDAELKKGASKKEISDRKKVQEFSILIDYRLGGDFPDERRGPLLDAFMALQDGLTKANASLLKRESSRKQHASNLARLNEEFQDSISAHLSAEEFRDLIGHLPGAGSFAVIDPVRSWTG